ncbi:hypothetical protein FA95DRAFT_1602930 [Auriscalpium vulgare]|uniref:Uncharacterized protein n=1 Tax=Auriscalpium vulgare TaxID=40419 RepID=A0ACB8S440_9AGAM|nr:hypothetical protein FA95DRAFT_1602930 [Auriscalpium vulgare]
MHYSPSTASYHDIRRLSAYTKQLLDTTCIMAPPTPEGFVPLTPFPYAPDPFTHQTTVTHLYRSSSLSATAASLTATISPPPAPVRAYIEALTNAANSTANAAACGSVLAGQGSESDIFGDVGVWLGDGAYGPGAEKAVLAALKCQSWLHHGRTIRHAELQPSTSLPATFKPAAGGGMELKELLGRLTDKHYFSIVGGAELDGDVAHFLIGRLSLGGVRGWAGLVGMGVAADY